MRLRRGTTAAFLSLQNYVFRGPPPYLSKHNKFPLCLPFLHLFLILLLFLCYTASLLHRLFFHRSLPGSATGTRLSFFHAATIYLLLLMRSFSISPCPRIRPSPFVRMKHIHTHTTSAAGPRLSADPSTSIVFLRRTRADGGANYSNRIFNRGIISRPRILYDALGQFEINILITSRYEKSRTIRQTKRDPLKIPLMELSNNAISQKGKNQFRFTGNVLIITEIIVLVMIEALCQMAGLLSIRMLSRYDLARYRRRRGMISNG